MDVDPAVSGKQAGREVLYMGVYVTLTLCTGVESAACSDSPRTVSRTLTDKPVKA